MTDLFDLTGDIVLITGGTGVIGRTFGRALLDAGATVILLGRGQTVPVEEAVEDLRSESDAGDRVRGYRADAADPDSLSAALDHVVADGGLPTVLVNGVGGNKGKAPFVEADLDLFREVVDRNLMGGLVIPTRLVVKRWIAAGIRGSIINVSSMAAHLPLSGVWAYGAAKAAVANLTAGCAKEFAPHGIRVNAISPGFFVGHQNRALLYENYEEGVLTERGKAIIDRTPWGRFGKPGDLYGSVVFLASRKASGFVTGTVLPVDGGYLIDNI